MAFDSAAWATGPFGFDPREVTAPIQRVATPPALHYDGQLKDWQLDATGTPLPAHPVDVGMVLSFIDPRNNSLQEIKYLGGDIAARISDAIKNAQPAKRLVEEGKAQILGWDKEDAAQGVKIRIRYRNLVTGQSDSVTA